MDWFGEQAPPKVKDDNLEANILKSWIGKVKRVDALNFERGYELYIHKIGSEGGSAGSIIRFLFSAFMYDSLKTFGHGRSNEGSWIETVDYEIQRREARDGGMYDSEWIKHAVWSLELLAKLRPDYSDHLYRSAQNLRLFHHENGGGSIPG